MSVRLFCDPRLGLDVEALPDGLRVDIPATAVDQLYYHVEDSSIRVSDDLRHFSGPNTTLDERAIYSLLQFAAVIPPLSLWKEVRRVVPGRTTIFRSAPSVLIEELSSGKHGTNEPGKSRDQLSLADQIQVISAVIDASLVAAARQHRLIILFSGGVDSGLLAARAAALGLKETILVNYCFGPEDAESILAKKMARHLGLRFEKIDDTSSGGDVEDVLRNAGKYYRSPFCDHSAIPTCALVRAVTGMFGSEYIVFDGTGADSCFGLFAKARQWQRVCSLPFALRRLGSIGYRLSGAWQRESVVEYPLRLLRRAEQFRYPLAAVAQNPFDGIAYHVRKEVREEVASLAFSWLDSICPADPHVQLAAMDLALFCTCVVAQKSRSLFAASDLDVVYPFLSPQMFDLALSAGNWDGCDGEAKWVLKAALSRFIPPEMVYRPKSSFVAPISRKFSKESFLCSFEKLVNQKSTISSVVESRFFRRLWPRIRRGDALPPQTARFVWAAVFVSEWLEQINEATDPAGPAQPRSPATPPLPGPVAPAL